MQKLKFLVWPLCIFACLRCMAFLSKTQVSSLDPWWIRKHTSTLILINFERTDASKTSFGHFGWLIEDEMDNSSCPVNNNNCNRWNQKEKKNDFGCRSNSTADLFPQFLFVRHNCIATIWTCSTKYRLCYPFADLSIQFVHGSSLKYFNYCKIVVACFGRIQY